MNLPIKITLILLVFIAASTAPVSCQEKHQSFPLSSVRLLPSTFHDAQLTDMRYMLQLSLDRLLAPFLREAGLKTKA